MNNATVTVPARATVPAQRAVTARSSLSMRELVTHLSDMLMVIQDEIAGGVAGQDATDEISHNEDSFYTCAALLRIFRQAQVTPGTRLARYVDNCVSAVEALDVLTTEGR